MFRIVFVSEENTVRNTNECAKVNRRPPGPRTIIAACLFGWIREYADADPLPAVPKQKHQ
jgi:hypothetical protein